MASTVRGATVLVADATDWLPGVGAPGSVGAGSGAATGGGGAGAGSAGTAGTEGIGIPDAPAGREPRRRRRRPNTIPDANAAARHIPRSRRDGTVT
ncbi:MAG TPA: hypothetical protein VMD28_02055 [Acidimicrobiales bacterium]|nr:hypothetical protein [Acidimicrobiales bacterium]